MTSRLRRLLVVVAAGLLYYSRLLRAWRFFRRGILRRKEVCVLGFHRVLSAGEEGQANSLAGIVLREATFARILEYLSQEFRVISLQTFLTDCEDRLSREKPCCLLTFDDGWRDTYLNAYPLLKKYGMPAVVFLVTGFVGTRKTFWVERLIRASRDPATRQRIEEHLQQVAGMQQPPDISEIVECLKHMPAKEQHRILAEVAARSEEDDQTNNADRMLAWDEIALLHQEEIEFGSHTVTHPLLVYEDDACVQDELRASKHAIEEHLRNAVRAFAYPNGTYDERVRSMVRDSGYACAFTTRRGWHCAGDDPFAIPRILLHDALVTGIDGQFSPALMSLRLSGLV